MIFAAGGLGLVMFLTIAFVGIADARGRVRRFEIEMDSISPAKFDRLRSENARSGEFERSKREALDAVSFNSSLLSTTKIHSQRQRVFSETMANEAQIPAECARVE
ncbi:MAG: hypothetical protein JOZ62_04770 [Acidobacteriaceae bacterium]|nr:hypothetical protein [Acidobacteriaceae bacterium]